MKNRFRFSISALPVFGLCFSPAAALDGDKQAITLVEKMLDQLGGKEIWAESGTLYLEYEGWRSNPAQPIDERAWRSLSSPHQRAEFEGRRSQTRFTMTPEYSWLEFSNAPPRRFTPEEHALNLSFWNYDFYSIIHNLARNDDRINLRLSAPRIVAISGPGGADWGWFEIDETGQPIRWGANYADEELEYIYGPVKRFGNINFPAWGTAVDGSWRFEYTVVDLKRAAFTVSAEPPE